MTEQQVLDLLSGLSLEEKIGEMTQLSPDFLGAAQSVDLTGPMKELNVRPEDLPLVGTTLKSS